MVFNIVAMTLAYGLLARGPTLKTGWAINITLASTGPGDLLWVNSGLIGGGELGVRLLIYSRLFVSYRKN